MADSGVNASVVDIGKLSEPITKLLDCIANATGVLYEPTHIRRVAKANAEQMIILADTEDELARRAAKRLAAQEIRRQQNIDNVVAEAVNELPEKTSNEPVDDAWLSRFFDGVQDVSDDELAKIWGRLLAGEVSQPKSYSRKLISLLKDLSPEDSEKFSQLAKLVFWDGDYGYCYLKNQIDMPLDHDFSRNPLLKYGIGYDAILDFESIGLLVGTSGLVNKISRWSIFKCGQYSFVVWPDGKSTEPIEFRSYRLTPVGNELYRLISSFTDRCQIADEQYISDFLKISTSMGLRIASIVNMELIADEVDKFYVELSEGKQ